MTLRDEPLPIVARCKACGRDFVTLPMAWPAYDPFIARGTPSHELRFAPPCGGEIERIHGETLGEKR